MTQLARLSAASFTVVVFSSSPEVVPGVLPPAEDLSGDGPGPDPIA